MGEGPGGPPRQGPGCRGKAAGKGSGHQEGAGQALHWGLPHSWVLTGQRCSPGGGGVQGAWSPTQLGTAGHSCSQLGVSGEQ